MGEGWQGGTFEAERWGRPSGRGSKALFEAVWGHLKADRWGRDGRGAGGGGRLGGDFKALFEAGEGRQQGDRWGPGGGRGKGGWVSDFKALFGAAGGELKADRWGREAGGEGTGTRGEERDGGQRSAHLTQIPFFAHAGTTCVKCVTNSCPYPARSPPHTPHPTDPPLASRDLRLPLHAGTTA